MSGVNWTKENIAVLKEHYAAGWSSSQIAAKIPYATRNAVIGKINRLGLAREKSVKSVKSVKSGVPYHLRRFETIKAGVDPGFVETPVNVTGIPVSEREGAMCCWPLDGGTCCGVATIGFRKPYCTKHTDLARRRI